MNLTRIRPAPVKKSLVVKATPEQAFAVFTADIGRWWPPSHHIGAAPFKTAVLEPRVGGRWYEVGEDGSECQWGHVHPPRRLVLAWQINSAWAFDPDLVTEVEVVLRPRTAAALGSISSTAIWNRWARTPPAPARASTPRAAGAEFSPCLERPQKASPTEKKRRLKPLGRPRPVEVRQRQELGD